MEFSNHYLKWVKYLKSQKLYGSWIKAVSTFYRYTSDWNIFAFSSKKTVFVTESIYPIIDYFNFGKEYVYSWMCVLEGTLKRYRISSISWTKKYKEFDEKENSKVILSLKLSRKICRANKKASSTKCVLREGQHHAWYDKSYEKNKFSKKSWRK